MTKLEKSLRGLVRKWRNIALNLNKEHFEYRNAAIDCAVDLQSLLNKPKKGKK